MSTTQGPPAPESLSPENRALVERVFGKPFMLDAEEGEDWNTILNAARQQGRDERIAVLERNLAGRDDFIVSEGLWSKFVDQLPPPTIPEKEG